MQTHERSNPPKDQQAAIEQLANAVVSLSAQRQHLRDYRQRAERSSLVNQALQAYRDYTRLQREPGAA